MTDLPWQNHIFGALRHPDQPAVLLSAAGEGWSLPALSGENIWLNSMDKILPAFESLLGVTVWGLRQFHYRQNRETRRTEMIVELELLDRDRIPELDGRWAGAEEVEQLSLAGGTPVGPLLGYLRELVSGAAPDLRPPWARPGWLPGASRWIGNSLAEIGVQVREIRPVKSWGISCVLHILTDRGDYYFKTTNRNMPLFVNEAAMTVALAERFPDAVPRPVAADPWEGWMLLPAFSETYDADSPTLNQSSLFGRFALLQIESIPFIDGLLAAGAIDRRLPVLAQQVEDLLADPEAVGLLDDPAREEIQSMLPVFRRLIERLSGLGIPDSLVHGDLHTGNTAVQDGRMVFFDWTDASVALPFFDLMALNWMDPADAAAAREAYLTPWKRYLAIEDLDEAVLLASALLNLHHAVSYQQIVRHLEPDSKVELNHTHEFLLEARKEAFAYLEKYPLDMEAAPEAGV